MNFLVFTDLDGTLLDHSDYSFAPALPAIQALHDRQVPIILASSKTAVEMRALHRALELGDAPMIVENGAAQVRADEVPAGQGGADYRRLRAALDQLPSRLRSGFKGFGDMTPQEIAQITGLSPQGAGLAAQRLYSEPGLWNGDAQGLQDFLSALAAQGISARRGGRFLTLSFGGTKAGQMQAIIARYRPQMTVALGDAPNDIEMLEAADLGVIVRNTHGQALPVLPGEAEGRIWRTQACGPAGWAEAIFKIIAQIDAKET